MINLSNVSKKSGNEILLNRINLKYSKKDKLNILITKTDKAKLSLINILFGLDQDFRGTYWLGKQNAKRLKPEEWNIIRYSHMQIVLQDTNLIEDITVNDNLYFASDCKNMLRFKKISEDLMAFFNIEFLKDDLVMEITGLEKRCVAIARALMNTPKILILDEPTVGLNEKEQKKMINYILELQNQDIIVLVLTSDSHFYRLGNSVYKISNRSKKVKKVKFKGKAHV